MSMSEKEDLNLFLSFYKESTARLTKAAKAYNRSLKKDPNPIIKTFREDLADLNEGGKMLRGMLVGLGYSLAGGKDLKESDPLSLAFEIFQTGILIHDDIIDNAETRRGKLTAPRCREIGGAVHRRPGTVLFQSVSCGVLPEPLFTRRPALLFRQYRDRYDPGVAVGCGSSL